MSPPRTASLTEAPGLTDRILDSIDELKREVTEVRSMLERRLTTIDDTAAKMVSLESRMLDLEKLRARGEGAAWAARLGWLVIGAIAGVVAWASGLFHH